MLSTDERNRLVWENRGLVGLVVGRYLKASAKCPAVVGLADLRQEGMLGLVVAAGKYRPGGAKFSTYACRYIRGYVQNYLCEHNPGLRLPRHTGTLRGRYLAAFARLTEERGREPGVSEVLDAMGLSGVRRELVRSLASTAAPLWRSGDAGEVPPFRSVMSPRGDTERADAAMDAAGLLSTLEPRRRATLAAWFGTDGRGLTGRDLAREMGCTQQNVSLIVQGSLAQLRETAGAA